MTTALKERPDLKAHLVRNRRSQVAIAAQMGINKWHLNRLLNGKAEWTRPLALSFAFATGIKLATIMDGQEA